MSVKQSSKYEIRADDGRQSVRLPHQYDFHDWQSFKSDTLRYHNIVHPDKNGLSDHMATFRSFMSPEVIEYLQSKHSGILDSGEFQSLDQWLLTVTELLRTKDATIPRLLAGPLNGMAERWAERYLEGTISEKNLWLELNELVDQDLISTEHQIRVFWDCHTGEEEKRILVNRCPYFDPADPVWDKDASYANRVIAVRLLNDVIQSDLSYYAHKYRKIVLICVAIACVLTLVSIIMFSLLAIPTVSSYDNSGAFTAFVSTGILCALPDLPLLVCIYVFTAAWRRALKMQRAYHLGTQPNVSLWNNGTQSSDGGLATDTMTFAALDASCNTNC